jgi:lysophospholipase L1-like esterase
MGIGTIHDLYDADTRFRINPITRMIQNESLRKTTLIQHDHNSEIFSFEIDRYVEGHDMSLCTSVEIHYNNISSATKEENKGLYPVQDMQISRDDEQKVVFSWLISEQATYYEGKLAFAIKFKCEKDGIVFYRWDSAINQEISVGKGIENSNEIAERYADILMQWELELFNAEDSAIKNIESKGRSTMDEVTNHCNDTYYSFNEDVSRKMGEMNEYATTTLGKYIEDVDHVEPLEAEVSTLKARMNEFTKLGEGSTTGDAELQDIRVGYQGYTYPNAGEAVRRQVAGVLNASLHYLGVLDGTSLLSELTEIGYYSVSVIDLKNIEDYPSGYTGCVFNIPNVRDGNKQTRFQIVVDNIGVIYVRNVIKTDEADNVAGEWLNTTEFIDKPYRGSVQGTSLATSTDFGYYNIPSNKIRDLVDCPISKSGVLMVYPNVRDGLDTTIMQIVYDNESNSYFRNVVNGVAEKWYDNNIKKPYRGSIPVNTIAELTDYGYYNVITTKVAELTDYPSTKSGVVINIPNIRSGAELVKLQIVFDADSIMYVRNCVETEATQWVSYKQPTPMTDNINISVIGDSITWGYYSDGVNLYIDNSRSFPSMLKNKGYNVNNLAIGGMGYIDPASTNNRETYLDVIYANDFTDCDCFIISGGINDYKGHQTLGEVTDKNDNTVLGVLNTIIDYFAEHYPNCRIIVTSPYNISSFGTYESKYAINTLNSANVPYTLGEMSNKLKEICETNCITYIDLLNSNCFNLKTIKTVLPDNVHPSLDAMPKLAGFVVAKILSEINGV